MTRVTSDVEGPEPHGKENDMTSRYGCIDAERVETLFVAGKERLLDFRCNLLLKLLNQDRF